MIAWDFLWLVESSEEGLLLFLNLLLIFSFSCWRTLKTSVDNMPPEDYHSNKMRMH